MERPKSEAAVPGNLVLEGKRIVGVDPVTIDFFSAEADADVKAKCCTAEYYHHARFNQSKASRERKLFRAANALEEWQGAIPPSRTNSVASTQAHVAYTTPRMQEVLAFHGTHQQRRQRWNCHIRKQRYLHVMAKRLAGRRPKVEVCSVCEQAGLRMLQAADGERPHAVRVCTHCHTVWNRDTNTARNMLCLLKCLAAGEDPLVALRRPAWHGGGGGLVSELDILQAEADGPAEAATVQDTVVAEDG